jgi:hypothetical protein
MEASKWEDLIDNSYLFKDYLEPATTINTEKKEE